MAKIRTLVKTKKQSTTCTGTGSVLEAVPHLFRTCTGTGSVLKGCTCTDPKVYRYRSPKMPRMCVFLPFFHMLIPKSTLYSIYTSKSLQIHQNGGLELHIHLITSILLKSSFNTYVSSKTFHECSQTTLIWVITPTQSKHKDLLGFILNLNSIT